MRKLLNPVEALPLRVFAGSCELCGQVPGPLRYRLDLDTISFQAPVCRHMASAPAPTAFIDTDLPQLLVLQCRGMQNLVH